MTTGGAPAAPWGGRGAQALVRKTLDTYGTTCHLCGLPGATTADHVIPRSKGGTNALRNLRPAHAACNYARGNRTVEGPASVIEDGQRFFTIE